MDGTAGWPYYSHPAMQRQVLYLLTTNIHTHTHTDVHRSIQCGQTFAAQTKQTLSRDVEGEKEKKRAEKSS